MRGEVFVKPACAGLGGAYAEEQGGVGHGSGLFDVVLEGDDPEQNQSDRGDHRQNRKVLRNAMPGQDLPERNHDKNSNHNQPEEVAHVASASSFFSSPGRMQSAPSQGLMKSN
eukprot:TRINITY_DN25562_c0_g1_i1.p1 TRINITY_DN25562_c0_g1~~TRINITY_DN25562_c0_g1_i1.p1  ORF type:complete len:113 (+),score=21.08 TRINITY_DN25562_c0_g1_i1:317-655(+)